MAVKRSYPWNTIDNAENGSKKGRHWTNPFLLWFIHSPGWWTHGSWSEAKDSHSYSNTGVGYGRHEMGSVPAYTVWTISNQPEVFILPLGENHLVTCSAVGLLAKLVRDLTIIHQMSPKCRLIWVNMLPQWMWWRAQDPKAIDKAKRNTQAATTFRWRHSAVIKQPGMSYGTLGFFF